MGIESYEVLLAIGGLVAGLMVGLTGMGGAVLVTPLLILGFGVPAAAAVSSDVVAGAIVTPVGSFVHARHGTVHWRLVLWLSLGSVPGVLIGTLIFAHVLSDSGLDGTLRTWIGAVLLVALVAMIARSLITRRRARAGASPIPLDDVRRGPGAPVRRTLTIVLGLVGGMVVGTTSVGSGSLFVTMLLLLYPLLLPAVLVGTDLVQAVPMLFAGALAHMTLGDVDWRITIALLAGQIPGVWIGARMSSRYNGMALRYLLMVVLAATALKLLGVATVICSVIAIVGIAVVGTYLVLEQRGRIAPSPAPGLDVPAELPVNQDDVRR